jgi:Tol biopolymer transport system component
LATFVLLLLWVPFLVGGLLLSLVAAGRARRALPVLFTVAAFATPILLATFAPGIEQPEQFAIQGSPWLAITASPDGSADLYLMEGDAQHVLPFGETPWTESFSNLSPDRRHIVFESDRYGSYDLFIMDLDASGNPTGTHRITRDPGNEYGASWSPDGSRIAYYELTGAESTIRTVDATGGTPETLATPTVAYDPQWSPDGRSIAFSAGQADDPRNLDIWIMGSDGSGARDVIDAGPTDWWPNWSPDGTRMAFTEGSTPQTEVYLANVDGSGVTRVTDRAGEDDAYGWSPDGSEIIFISDRSNTGGRFLYVMDPSGSDVRLVLRI